MNVCVVGHACSPVLGSEPGNTWNWAWHLSARYHVWVVTHPQYRRDIEEFLAAHPGRNLQFVWVTPPKAIDPWQPSRSDRFLRIHYVMWLRYAYRAVAKLQGEVGLDLCHHVSLNTISAPPPFRSLPVLKVWGPVGGGQKAPVAFRDFYGRQWRRQSIRDFCLRLLPHLPLLRRTIGAASLVLATNRETEALLRGAGAKDVRLFLDCGIPGSVTEAISAPCGDPPELTLLWAGRLENFKGLPIALQAMQQAPDLPVRLLIAGDGTARKAWEALVQDMSLGRRVRFLGKVPFQDMQQTFRQADVFLFTSLCDSSGSVVLEAMSQGLPLITLDHQGIGTFAPDDASCKVPVTEPAATVKAFTRALEQLAGSPELRHRMGVAARRFARTQEWRRKAEQMICLYEELVVANRHL